MNLLETYQKRLAVSEGLFKNEHQGKPMSKQHKLFIAKCLENTDKFLTEAFNNSTGTQRSDFGMWKKFALNLTTVALPNLIAPELVITSPMSAMSGYVTYVQYTAGSNKGTVKQGNLFRDPFGNYNENNEDGRYTSNVVVETIADGQTELAWGPVVKGTIQKFVDNAWVPADSFDAEGEYVPYVPKAGDKVKYVYDNVVIPQNDLPIINAQIESIALIARARRIAVYYSQIAAFQAKTDYGMDLGDQLAKQAAGQLAYEIDTEVVALLDKLATENANARKENGEKINVDAGGNDLGYEARLHWSRKLPNGVSKADHYEGFAEIVGIGNSILYGATQKFAATYMLIAHDILPTLTFIKGFQAAPNTSINGPYFAGTLNGLKVFVSPAMKRGRFVLGVNGDDMMSSAAVYAPYMPIVPTQLLQYADGGTSQGWSTLYDLKPLNKNLVVAGQVDGEPNALDYVTVKNYVEG
jgi:hypothetical protein